MSGLDIISAGLKNLSVEFAEPVAQLKQRINDGRVVILKECFDADRLIELKKAIQQWGFQQTVFPAGKSASIADINFHRIDGPDMPTKLPHIFHQYGFGDIAALDQTLREAINQVAIPMLSLQNAIAGTHYRLTDPEVRVKFLHYPAGGGYLANHIHPLQPQRVGLITSLSAWNEDYHEGGNIFSCREGNIESSPSHHVGDLLLFRYDIPHEIKPIDPGKTLDWRSLAGKWSLVLELLETNARSESVEDMG